MSKLTRTLVVLLVLAGVLGYAGGASAKERAPKEKKMASREPERPRTASAVDKAIHTEFPDAVIQAIDADKESGLAVDKVKFRSKEDRYEALVTKEGSIVAVSKTVKTADLSQAVLDELKRQKKGMDLEKIERVDYRGDVVGGRFLAYKAPEVFYEAKVEKDGDDRKLMIPEKMQPDAKADYDDDKPGKRTESALDQLPAPVKNAILKDFPRAVFHKVERDKRHRMNVYQATIVQDKVKMEVEVSPSGVITRIERDIPVAETPKMVVDQVMRQKREFKINKVESTEYRADIKGGRTIEYKQRAVLYDVEVKKDDEKSDIKILDIVQ